MRDLSSTAEEDEIWEEKRGEDGSVFWFNPVTIQILGSEADLPPGARVVKRG